MDKKYKLLRADFLVPMSDPEKEERIQDGYVLIRNREILEAGRYDDETGKRVIHEYGRQLQVIGDEKDSFLKTGKIVKHKGIIMPGFVKAHGHDHESPIIGIAKDVPLTSWLDKAVNLFTGFMNEKRDELEKTFGKSPNLVTYLKARLDDIYYGITSCLVHHCNHNKYRLQELAEANTIAGTKMIAAVGSQDRNYDKRILDIPARVAVERLDRYRKEFGSVRDFQVIPGPDQLFSNGPELLKSLKKWARDNGTLIHTHSSEEPRTTAWFIKKYGQTPIEYAKSIDFLDGDTILAHQVQSTDNDLRIIQKTGAKVVHNPLANTILGSGMPRIVEMMEMGIPVAISTDGSGSADNQNIINAARLASQYQKAFHKNAKILPAFQLLKMITVVPAGFLRLNTGQIKPGKDADIILVDLDCPNLTPTRQDNLLENLIWAANGNEIRYVISNGKILKDDYRFTTLDEDLIKREVTELSGLLVDYLRTAKEIHATGSRSEENGR